MFDLGKLVYTIEIDDKAAKSSLKSMDKSLKAFGSQATKTGKSLTKSLTLPILAVGGAALKLASDFEVSSRKFAGAFKGAEKEASDSVANLSENFGLASSQATALLAFTGDLLKGFGATSEEALNLANSTQEIAAALAAYNGVPVKQASEAVTKALLGERESLKLLGVAIKETDVQQQLLLEGKDKLTGQALMLAKAEATLKLAYKQSADAVDNFASNMDTAAFQTSALIADAKDLGVELGTTLLPMFKDVIGSARELVGWFGDLSEGQKSFMITLAGLVAISGPAITAIGGIATAIGVLSGPAGWAVLAGVAVVGLTAAVVELGKKAHKERLEELNEEFGELAKNTGVAEDEMEKFLQASDLIAGALSKNWGAGMADVAYQVEQLAINTGMTKQQIVGIGLASEYTSEKQKEILGLLESQYKVAEAMILAEDTISLQTADQYRAREQSRIEAERSVKAAEEEVREQEKITAEKLKQNEADRVIGVIGARKDALTLYNQEVEDAQDRFRTGLIDEKELLGQLKGSANTYGEALITAGYDGVDASQVGNQELERMVGIIGNINTKLNETTDIETDLATKRTEFSQSWLNKLAEQSDNRLYLLEQEKKTALKNAKEIGAGTLAIEAYYNEERTAIAEEMVDEEDTRREEEYQKDVAAIQGKIALAQQFVASLSTIYDNLLQIQYNNIDAETQAKIESLDKKTLGEEEYKKKVLALEKKAAIEKYNIERKAYRAKQAFDISQVILNAGVAIMKGYAQLGPFGGSIAAAILVAIAGTQIGVIASRPPPAKPAFAEGAIVSNPGPGIDAIVGEAGPEAILPLNDKTLGALGQAIVESTTATTSSTSSGGAAGMIFNLIIEGMGKMTIPVTQDALNNGQLLVNANALV